MSTRAILPYRTAFTDSYARASEPRGRRRATFLAVVFCYGLFIASCAATDRQYVVARIPNGGLTREGVIDDEKVPSLVASEAVLLLYSSDQPPVLEPLPRVFVEVVDSRPSSPSPSFPSGSPDPDIVTRRVDPTVSMRVETPVASRQTPTRSSRGAMATSSRVEGTNSSRSGSATSVRSTGGTTSERGTVSSSSRRRGIALDKSAHPERISLGGEVRFVLSGTGLPRYDIEATLVDVLDPRLEVLAAPGAQVTTRPDGATELRWEIPAPSTGSFRISFTARHRL